MEKDYLIPFEAYAEDHSVEKRSKFTGRLWRVRAEERRVGTEG